MRGGLEGRPPTGSVSLCQSVLADRRWREVVEVAQKGPMIGAGRLRGRKWQVGQRMTWWGGQPCPTPGGAPVTWELEKDP